MYKERRFFENTKNERNHRNKIKTKGLVIITVMIIQNCLEIDCLYPLGGDPGEGEGEGRKLGSMINRFPK